MPDSRPRKVATAIALLVSASSADASPTTKMGQDEPITVTVYGGDAAAVEVRPSNEVELLKAKFVFARALGSMSLRRVDVYANDNVSGYYTRFGGGNGDPFLTLYAYPASKPIADEVGDVKAALVDRFKASPIKSLFPDFDAPQLMSGCYSGTADNRSMDTCFWLVKRGNWFIKVRLTLPKERKSDAIDVAMIALRSIPWNWTPPNTSALNSNSHSQ